MHKLFASKQLHLYIDNEKFKISTDLNTVSMILLHSAIIVWHILRIDATVVTYYYYRCKQENATCVTTFHYQFIQK